MTPLQHAGLALAVTALGALGACATPAARISTALQERGLDAQRADCVGDRLDANLSVSQLLQLRRATEAYSALGDTSPGRLTTSDLVRVAANLGDVRVPLEVGRAVAACDLLSATGAQPR